MTHIGCPIQDLTLNQYPVSGLPYNWAFVHGLINNDEKVASSKNKPNLRLECKNHTLFETKMAMIDTLFLTKMAKKHTIWGHTYLYSPYKGVSSLSPPSHSSETNPPHQPVYSLQADII